MPRSTVLTLFGVALATTILATPAAAQSLESTVDLRNACQQAPNNTITLQQNTKISSGAGPIIPEAVNCGCTVIIPAGLKLEFENVGMTFAGGITFRSTGLAEVRLQNTSLNATSIAVSLLGKGSILSLDRSSVVATTGDVTATFGEEGLLVTRNRLIPGDGYSVRAAGEFRIAGGAKLGVDMEESRMEASRGFSLEMGGPDGLVKCDTLRILAPAGGISITSASEKSTAEFKSCWIVARDQIALSFGGAQSKLSLNATNIIREDAKAAPATVTVEVMGAEGNLEAKQVGLQNANSTMTMRTGTRGSTKIENAGASVAGTIEFVSGVQGTTEVKDCYLTSSTRIRITSGGSCNSSSNLLTAPIVETCQ